MASSPTTLEEKDVVILGAGFGGLTMAIQLRLRLRNTDFVIYEQTSGLGGVWRANKYPGCSVDTPCVLYSLSFALKPDFSTLYPSQPEILAYMQDLSEKYSLGEHYCYDRKFLHATWNEVSRTWLIRSQDLKTGQIHLQRSKILISAIGNLSKTSTGEIENMEVFKGRILHTSEWDSSVVFVKKNIALIGNGSSATQIIPAIINEVKTLTQFMRTPQFYQRGWNPSIPWAWVFTFMQMAFVLRLCRYFVFNLSEFGFKSYTTTVVGDRQRRRATIKLGKETRGNTPSKYWPLLLPDYKLGCKRIILEDGYFDALSTTNFRLIRDPVKSCEEDGIVTESGKKYKVDIIILATGFITGNYPLELVGRVNTTLQEHWAQFGGLEAYKMIAVSGFPNFFMINGPYAGLAHTSALYSIENSVDLIISVIKPLVYGFQDDVEIRASYEQKYDQKAQKSLALRVWRSCNSYYGDQNGRLTFLYPWSAYRMYFETHFEDSRAWVYRRKE